MSLDEQIRVILADAMGDFPTEHLLDYHTDNFKALIAEQVKQARIEELNWVHPMPLELRSTIAIEKRLAELENQ